MKIRSITLHIPENIIKKKKPKQALEEANNMLSFIESSLRREGINVWTKRLVVPIRVFDSLRNLTNSLDVVEQDVLVALGKLRIGEKYYNELDKILEMGHYTYVRVGSFREIPNIAKKLASLSAKDYNIMTKVGVNFYSRKEVVTPYFPITDAPSLQYGPVLTVSLLYVREFLENVLKNKIDVLAGKINEINRLVKNSVLEVRREDKGHGIQYNGFDLSLSPWMEESVGYSIEKIGECNLEDINCVYSVYKINKLIIRLARKINPTTGFNELMLAVGEDDYLKQKVYDKKFGVKEFVNLLPACLVGMDMVALRTNYVGLKKILYTLLTIANIKKRPLGFRGIILPQENKIEKIVLERFGDIPVMEFIQ